MEFTFFKYPVDDLSVSGYVIRPKGQTGQPILIRNRGANGRYCAVLLGKMMSSIFSMAEKGFAIIGGQYRGASCKEVGYGCSLKTKLIAIQVLADWFHQHFKIYVASIFIYKTDPRSNR